MDTPVDLHFCQRLPKIELHAHLSGSISRECLHDIWLARKAREPDIDLQDPQTALPTTNIDVQTFFPLFSDYIYKLVDNKEAIRQTTLQVLADFEADNVHYIELRTTPRNIERSGITEENYVEIVLDAMDEYAKDPKHQLRAKLILSVDRRDTPEQANSTVDIAVRLRHRAVVGVDLCGNPSRLHIQDLLPALRRAKAEGLGLTVHFAEIEASSTDEELEGLLDLNPERLGHVIHVKDEFKQRIVRENIGVELCLSCNVQSKMTGDFGEHHFGWWRNNHNMVALSTDDVGIFNAPLSEDYYHAARHHGMNKEQMMTLAEQPINMIFMHANPSPDEKMKEWLRQGMSDFRAREQASILA